VNDISGKMMRSSAFAGVYISNDL